MGNFLFVFARTLWFFARIDQVLLILLVAGIALQVTIWARTGKWLILVSTAVLVAIVLLPIHGLILGPLENRFPPPTLPQKVDGIVILSGVIQMELTPARKVVSMGDAGERLFEPIGLMRKYPDAKVIFSGGSGSIWNQEFREADMAKDFYESIGVNTSRIIFERNSRNTYENAVESKKVGDPKPGEKWVLVTSAFHMPRAVGLFRKAGWEVIPYPVDYRTRPNYMAERPSGLFDVGPDINIGLKEWLGLSAYFLLNRTSAFFPGP